MFLLLGSLVFLSFVAEVWFYICRDGRLLCIFTRKF